MRRLGVIMAGAIILLAASPGWTRCWRNQHLVKLDIKELAKKSPWAGLSPVEQKKLEAMGKKYAALQPVGRSVAVAWTPCSRSACRAQVGLARIKKGALKVYQSVTLPHKGWSMGGVELHETAVTDMDGDGKRELLVSYTITTKPERAVGSRYMRYLAVLALPSLTLQLVLESERGGQATVHERCEVKLNRADTACTGHPRIIRRSTCREAHCWDNPEEKECKDSPFSYNREVYVWQKVSDRYAQQKEKVAPVKDGKPWAVVRTSIDLDRRQGQKVARRWRDKLHKAGFPTAEVVDGRRFANFRCCYWVVVAGRFATRAEAMTLVRQLKKKKISSYPRRAF